jgi:hypothetical protein
VLGVPDVHAQRSGVIAGLVVDGVTGKPITAAVVAVSGPTLLGTWQVPKVLTDTDGRFVFGGLEAGLCTVTATKGGYADGVPGRRRAGGSAPPVRLTAADASVNVTVPMWRYSAISGTVVDEAGEPVVNVQVRTLSRDAGTGRYRKGPATFTDDRGAYRVGALVAGDYLVVAVPSPLALTTARRREVYPPTFHPSTLAPAQAGHVTLGSGEDRGGVDVQVASVIAARVSGVLLNGGRPVPLTPVLLVPSGSDAVPGDILSPRSATDSRGAFTFAAVAPGRYEVRASSGGSGAAAWTALPVVVTGEDIDALAVTMNPALRITARSRFEGTAPLPPSGSLRFADAPFTLEAVDRDFDMLSLGATFGESGTFSVTGFLPGRYRVRVPSPPRGWTLKAALVDGIDVSETPFDLKKDVTDLTLVFTDRPSSVKGHVEAREPAVAVIFTADASAWIDASPTSRRFRDARVDDNGDFVINGVPPGEYYAIAVSEDQASNWRDPARIEQLAREATRVSVGEGEMKIVTLGVKDVR